jgi:predicted  nucleic acid-binding Zn-ribbon protein
LAVNTEKVNELVEEMTVLKRNKRDIEAPLENERIEKEKAEEKVGELSEEHVSFQMIIDSVHKADQTGRPEERGGQASGGQSRAYQGWGEST